MRRKTIIEEIQRQREMMGLITEAGGENPVTLIRRVIQSAKEVGDNDIAKYFGKEAAEDLERLGIKNLDELDLKLTNGVRDLPVGFEPRMLGRGGVVDALIPNLVKDVSRRIFTDPSMGWVAKRIVGDYFGQFGNKQLSAFGDVIMKLDLTNPNVIGRSDVQEYLKKAKNAFEQVLGPEEDFTKWFNNYYAKQVEDGSFVGADKTGLKLDTPTKTDLEPTAPKTGEEPTTPKTDEEPTPPKQEDQPKPLTQAEREALEAEKRAAIEKAREEAIKKLDEWIEAAKNTLMGDKKYKDFFEKNSKKINKAISDSKQELLELVQKTNSPEELLSAIESKISTLISQYPKGPKNAKLQKMLKGLKDSFGVVYQKKSIEGDEIIQPIDYWKTVKKNTGGLFGVLLISFALAASATIISNIIINLGRDETLYAEDIFEGWLSTTYNIVLMGIEKVFKSLHFTKPGPKVTGTPSNTESTYPDAKYMNNLDDFKKFLGAEGIEASLAIPIAGGKYKQSPESSIEYSFKLLDKNKNLGTFE